MPHGLIHRSTAMQAHMLWPSVTHMLCCTMSRIMPYALLAHVVIIHGRVQWHGVLMGCGQFGMARMTQGRRGILGAAEAYPGPCRRTLRVEELDALLAVHIHKVWVCHLVGYRPCVCSTEMRGLVQSVLHCTGWLLFVPCTQGIP